LRRTEPWDWQWPFASLTLRNSTVSGNSHGVVTRHYNQPSNEWLDIFSRYRWEMIRMFGLHLINNRYEAVHALSITRYNYLYLPTFEELQRALKIAEIHYTLESCLFEGNGGGVLAEHNHVEFSNNVWIWQLSSNRFERNVGGGFMIELPRVRKGAFLLKNPFVMPPINSTIIQTQVLSVVLRRHSIHSAVV
jgi:hypothetical protein